MCKVNFNYATLANCAQSDIIFKHCTLHITVKLMLSHQLLKKYVLSSSGLSNTQCMLHWRSGKSLCQPSRICNAIKLKHSRRL